MRRFLSIFVLSFGILCFQPDVLALRVDRAAYRYPYRNPYLATTTLSVAKGRDVLLADDDVSRRSLDIKILDGRDNTYLLEGKGKLRFRQQTGSAPLIFIIPGLGSPAASGSAPYLAEVLVDQGFHVLILPSPFNWNFALAASRSGLPGITQEDSEDLYSAMQLILQHIKIHHGRGRREMYVYARSQVAAGSAGYLPHIRPAQQALRLFPGLPIRFILRWLFFSNCTQSSATSTLCAPLFFTVKIGVCVSYRVRTRGQT